MLLVWFWGLGTQQGDWHFIQFNGKVIGARIEPNGSVSVQTSYSDRSKRWTLKVEVFQEGEAAGVKFCPEGESWDLSRHQFVCFDVCNLSRQPMVIYGKISNGDTPNLLDNCRMAIVLMPGESKTLKVRIVPRPEDPTYEPFKGQFMYHDAINVRDNTVEPSEIRLVEVWIDHPKVGQVLEVRSVYASGKGRPAPAPFFPFVDKYGQYIHSDWPGKIYSDRDFASQIREEQKDLKNWRGPSDWCEYGGWAKGPKFEATGYFYIRKVNEKWWFVDPHGHLFWSYGPTGVGYGGDLTRVSGREHWFKDLPDPNSKEWGRFYHRRPQGLFFDFAAANLYRKFGRNFEAAVAELLHKRLRSWGFNTIGNWSDLRVYLLRKTPYTVAIHYGGPWIPNYEMPDVFHPDFESALKERMEQERGTTANDPWNIGYFADNELWWGWRPKAAMVGEAVMRSGAEVASKRRFVEMLMAKYDSVQEFNKAWGVNFGSWEEVLKKPFQPNMNNQQVLQDCGAFGMVFAERYFSTVRRIVKSVAPKNLYLGCRFHGHIDAALVELAWEYCDVISYNVYDNPPDRRVNQYLHLDIPILSSEWGVSSDPQQTPFRSSKGLSPDPRDRARNMERYFEIAVRHPMIVGAHFFQFRDQPLTGRPDGEAVLRGFLNVTDAPHFDLVQTNRRIAYELYCKRFELKAGHGEESEKN
ncbi:MAG: beta-galactosidase [Candidatus Fervidibacter sp.]|uniref:beta-galactosidase n=1 Tax=Candidatus Fervidibacter sp. TaxID=3100871 RepID=UPI0040498B99